MNCKHSYKSPQMPTLVPKSNNLRRIPAKLQSLFWFRLIFDLKAPWKPSPVSLPTFFLIVNWILTSIYPILSSSTNTSDMYSIDTRTPPPRHHTLPPPRLQPMSVGRIQSRESRNALSRMGRSKMEMFAVKFPQYVRGTIDYLALQITIQRSWEKLFLMLTGTRES